MTKDKILKLGAGKIIVFFDLDNTLYSYLPCHERGLKAAWKSFSGNIDRIPFKEFSGLYDSARGEVKKTTRGQAASHSRILYFQRLLETYCGRTISTETLLMEAAYWEAYMKKMKLFPWVLPVFNELKMRGTGIGIITDLTARIQHGKLAELGVELYIDFLVTSEEAGAEKPSASIFRLALKKAGCRASETVFIGDDPAKDKNSVIPYALL